MSKHNIESSIRGLFYLISKTEHIQKLAGIKFFKSHLFTLTYEQMDVLHILYQGDNISQSELGKIALKDKANIARILRILEKKEFISRELGTHNKRMVKKVLITSKGRNEIDKMMPLILEVHKKIMKGISKEQVENLKTTLEIYRKNIEENFNINIDI